MDALSYIILTVTIISLVIAVVYLDGRRNRWLDISRSLTEELARVSNSEKFYAQLYSLACEANDSMAKGMAQYRARITELESLVPATPSVSPDDAIASMKYCGTCHTFMHPNHFVVQPMHYATTSP